MVVTELALKADRWGSSPSSATSLIYGFEQISLTVLIFGFLTYKIWNYFENQVKYLNCFTQDVTHSI